MGADRPLTKNLRAKGKEALRGWGLAEGKAGIVSECNYSSSVLGPAGSCFVFNLGMGVSERGQSVQCLQFCAKPRQPCRV